LTQLPVLLLWLLFAVVAAVSACVPGLSSTWATQLLRQWFGVGLLYLSAGVRHGFPLSPLLYLFVAEAAARWLRADTALGISLASHRLVSAHHEDTKVYMPDLKEDTAKHLLERKFLFGQASGQYVNPAKFLAVPLYGLSVSALLHLWVLLSNPSLPLAGVAVLIRVQACVYGEGSRLSNLPHL
jgi:hypothetical protein